jgi:hypothetical protein
MKTRLLVTLVALAISFALPTLAQEKDTINSKIRQQMEALDTKYDEAFNKHDGVLPPKKWTRKTLGLVNLFGVA